MIKQLVLVALAIVVVLFILGRISKNGGETIEVPVVDVAKNTVLGTALSPAHVPRQSDKDVGNFFNLAAQMGGHVTFIIEWENMPKINDLKNIRTVTLNKGLEFHIHLSPIALYGGRKTPAIPPKVNGESFTEPDVRKAFTEQALELAAIKPDYLGLGTEVNFLAANPEEFEAYKSLVAETSRTIKEKYPNQIVTVSFQWDVMRKQGNYEILNDFKNIIDVYSFTTYPDAVFSNPNEITPDYYSKIREALPNARIGFSEVGWSSANSEDVQAAFYQRLPQLVRDARPDYVTLALMHDLKFFTGELEPLNHVGVRNYDGRPKKAWDVVLNLMF